MVKMALKVNIKRILLVTFWCIAGAGVTVLLVAAIKYRSNKTCKGYKIDITGPAGEFFIGKKEINDLLASAGAGTWKEKPTQAFDLRKMEAVLEKNVWIRDAQLFFDNNGVLQVKVIEREPVARIFTRSGNSFYIDSSGMRLPLSDKLPVKLPVFTDYPDGGAKLHGQDSILTVEMRALSAFITRDSFWMAQIAQIDILPDRTFELIPTVGNHLIEFGDGEDYEQKFRRLFVFYKEVLSRTGMDKYSRIDVAYAGQVIGTKKGSEGSRFDSLQGIKNVEQLIRTAQQLQADTVRQQNIKPLERSTQTEQTLTNYDLIPDSPSYEKPRAGTPDNRPATKPVKPVSNPVKAVSNPVKAGTRPAPVKAPAKQNPKAIMPRKNK